ncbi:MAG: DNA primase [Patescibacteria group bacterium]
MNSPVDTIKERLSISDVISSYLPITESGKNYKARCPFHNEKTPSFFISPERNTYYCFGCGAKGDIFSFVEQFEGVDFRGALKLLADRAGISLSEYRSESHDEKERWYEIMEEAALYFETQFVKIPEGRSYLADRGLTDETMKLFRIGYAPDAWRSVSEYLIKKGYVESDLEKVGLIKRSEKGFYDRFRSRIMFPIQDSSGRVIAFSGRIFGKDVPTNVGTPTTVDAKYLNSPDTPLFNKSHVLFGIDKAKAAIRSRGYSIVVEGQMDLILSHQAGFNNTVAVSGTALAENTTDSEAKINNLGLIRRLSSNIIFAFDGDEAGIRAASRSAAIALALDMQVKIAKLPEGKDPADIIGENTDGWKDIIRHAANIVSFHVERICAGTPDIRIRGRKIRDIVFPFIIMVRSAIERSAYITDIASRTGLREDAVREDFQTFEKTHAPVDAKPNMIPKTQEIISRRGHLERRLSGILFWQTLDAEHNQKIKDLCLLFEENMGPEMLENIKKTYEPFADNLAFEAQLWYGNKTDGIIRDAGEILLNLEEEILYERKTSLQPLDTREKLIEFDALSKRIEDIKHKRSQ